MRYGLFLAPVVCSLLAGLTAGCRRDASSQSSTVTRERNVAVAHLSDRDAEVICFVLHSHDSHPGDRIYFVTVTPIAEWSIDGGWSRLPESFHESIVGLQTKYRPATKAYLCKGRVLEHGTDAKAWMRWVTIKEWTSPTEVVVEDGVWCCPLGGGASTVTYEKVDGRWRIKELGPSWRS